MISTLHSFEALNLFLGVAISGSLLIKRPKILRRIGAFILRYRINLKAR